MRFKSNTQMYLGNISNLEVVDKEVDKKEESITLKNRYYNIGQGYLTSEVLPMCIEILVYSDKRRTVNK